MVFRLRCLFSTLPPARIGKTTLSSIQGLRLDVLPRTSDWLHLWHADEAKRAEEHKRERYPTKDGRAVTPFAVETWGRVGEHGEQLLQTLAAEAVRHTRSRGQQTTAGAFTRRWRASLDAILQRGIAMCLASARCGLAGRAHQRRCHPRSSAEGS